MNYGELKTRILDFAHRPDLSSQVVSFVSLAEGMIRRDLRALALSVTLDDDDRVSDGIYTLPSTLDEVRAIYVTGPNGPYALDQVALSAVRRLDATVAPLQFCVNSSTVEIRGVPATDAELDLHYLGHPAPLSADGDENELLTKHESLYVFGALSHLHQYTQDLELAQAALDTFGDSMEKANEQYGRKLGGATVASAYHFGPMYHGY
jgi:hypothetical protein